MKPIEFSGECSHRQGTSDSVAAQMRAFLAGYDTGAALLHALYDEVLDEPVPAHLRAMMKQ